MQLPAGFGCSRILKPGRSLAFSIHTEPWHLQPSVYFQPLFYPVHPSHKN
ncbi:hypothetical protein B14911_00305 [Bacillus sp. NRRL B-14911]|uniref:Uncharacterized protein n=1 Tax=Bacillus infantis NRRL B-14911 TaxID=1367477 RepID=U5L937_9BACI|nr:hypothetical protein N288_09980 [Bacillus infantis NRRL B-14911]EAR63264.1 hypothetical protein B14911_00305 [Bacillus sp. NRRL B-14911]